MTSLRVDSAAPNIGRGLLAFAAGAAIVVALQSCGCPDGPGFASSYRIVNEPTDWVAESGRVDVDEGAVLVTYTTRDGARWEVEYRRTDSDF